MIDPIILSDTNEEEALAVYNLWLNDKYTLLVVPGTHQEAVQALEAANDKVNSGHVHYASVRVVHAPKPEFIVPDLKFLKVNPKLKKIEWQNIGQYAILSISNKYNNLAYIFNNAEMQDNIRGKINYMVLQAQANDLP